MKTKMFEDYMGDSLDVSLDCGDPQRIDVTIFEAGDQACVCLDPEQIPALCEALLKAARKAKG